MPILSLLASLVSWVFRTVVIKFVILAALYAVMALVIPKLIDLVTPAIGTGSLTSAMMAMGPGVWYFLDFFALDLGLPLIISAAVTRFLIRRLPLIG